MSLLLHSLSLLVDNLYGCVCISSAGHWGHRVTSIMRNYVVYWLRWQTSVNQRYFLSRGWMFSVSSWLELCGWEDLIRLSIKHHDAHVVQRTFCWVFVVSYLCWLLELSTGYVSIVVSVPVFVKPQDSGWGLITLISDICGHTVMWYSTNMCLFFWQDLRCQTGFLF